MIALPKIWAKPIKPKSPLAFVLFWAKSYERIFTKKDMR